MPTPLRDTPIRRKLLNLTVVASLAFLAVSLLFVLNWRSLEKSSSRVAAIYVPVLRDASGAIVNLAAIGTELTRYVNQAEPAPYRIHDAIEAARQALRRMDMAGMPEETRRDIGALVRLLSEYEGRLMQLRVYVERDNVLAANDMRVGMLAEASAMLQAVERINSDLWERIVLENQAGVERSFQRTMLAVALGFACMLGALVYLILLRRDLDEGLGDLRISVRRYLGGETDAVAALPRRDELGQLSRFLGQLSGEVRAGEARLREQLKALRESEELARFWLANIPIPIVIYDPEGRVQYLNPAFAATFRWELEDVLGSRMPFVPEDRMHELSGVLERLRTVGRANFETQRLTRDGRLLDIYIATSMARGSDGTPRSTMVSLTDMTERRRMELELAASREEALQATQAKSAFLAAMSHEIRTPLNGVLGMAGLLAGTGLDAEQRDYVETIRISGDALLSVINDILDYSKIESGHMELEDQPFEPVRAVEESLEILGERARSKHLELLAEVDDSVPGWVRGDFARLRQVLVNLVGNAVKFTEHGEIVVHVKSAAGGALEFAVRDTGIGIAPGRLATLFEPFTQADASTTRRYGGTGLGLAISRRLVELMGGQLRAESEPGRGSIFFFEVRATRCAPPTDLPAAPRAVDLAGRRVLIVDDNATNLRILRRQLDGWGAVPVAAASGEAALELLSAPFDLALLDYHMPVMDGVMLARRIKARTPQLPLVLLSSSMYRHAEEAEKGLFVEQLLKPVRQQQLRDAIAAALTGSRAPGPARRSRIGRAAGQPSLRVLVVDDVEVNRRVARALLRELGHEYVEATGGLEAVEIAAGGGFDSVLMDLQMPDIDGLEATRRIRERLGARAPRIVGMTANAMPGDRERCLQAGMDGYLSKPIDPVAFAAELGGTASPVTARQERAIPAPAPTEPLIDHVRIRLLLEYDDEQQSMVKGVIDTFLRDAPRYLEAIRDAHARRDYEQLAHHAHALKGAASNAAAPALSAAASRLEAVAQDGTAGNGMQLIATLPETYGRTAAALNEERERLGALVAK